MPQRGSGPRVNATRLPSACVTVSVPSVPWTASVRAPSGKTVVRRSPPVRQLLDGVGRGPVERGGERDGVVGASLDAGECGHAAGRVLVALEPPLGVVGEADARRPRIGERGEQAVGAGAELDGLAGGVGDARQVAVGVDGEGRPLAVGAEDGGRRAAPSRSIGGHVAVAVGDARQASGAVVGEEEARRSGQRVQGAQVPALLVEEVELAAVLGGDEEVR